MQITYKTINQQKITEAQRSGLLSDFGELLERSWGRFEPNFLKRHIVNSKTIALARTGEKLIAFSAVSEKNLLEKKILYVEFTVVDSKYQKSGLGDIVTLLALKKELLKRFLKLITVGVEIMFLTPNIRALSTMIAASKYTYPNPYKELDETGRISAAEQKIFDIAQALIASSDNPNRELNREGLIVKNSYKDTPWLIYGRHNAPWHKNEIMNRFARRYLGYGQGKDLELLVYTRVTFFSIIASILRTWYSSLNK